MDGVRYACVVDRLYFDTLAMHLQLAHRLRFGTDEGIESLTNVDTGLDVTWFFSDPKTSELLVELRWTPFQFEVFA